MVTNKKNQHIEEIDILDYTNVLLRHRWMIIRNVLIVGFAVAIISLFLPRSYTARTTLLPPDENKETGILSALSGSPLSQLGITQFSSTSDLFVQILRSRTVFDDVLKRTYSFDGKDVTLLDVLEIKSLEKGRRNLADKVTVSATKEGVVQIAVELSDAQLAADVANALVEALDRVNKEKYTSRAKNSRIYIENQLQLTETKLQEASNALARFQEQFKAVALEDQTRTAIEKAGEIKGKIIAKEVELGVAMQTMKSNNVYIIQLQKEIEELKKQYNYLQFGDSLSIGNQDEFYIPFSEVPEVGLELAELIREVKVQETVWGLLNQQFYQAKIQEAKDTPTVQVLDEAVAPEFRTKPKRGILTVVSAFLAFLFSIFWAFALEFYAKIKTNPKARTHIDTVRQDVSNIRYRAGQLRKRISRLLTRD